MGAIGACLCIAGDGGCGAEDLWEEGRGQRDRGLKSWDVLVTLVLGPICDLYIQDSQT